MSRPLIVATLWSLALLGSFLWAARHPPHVAMNMRRASLIVITVALLARLVPHTILPMGAGYDIDSYQIVADLLRTGSDVYTSPTAINRHPYLPFQMYWMVAARVLALTTNLPFLKLVRLLPIGADVAIAFLLFRTLAARHRSSAMGLQGGLLYALNPLAVYVSAFHGQFDAVPLLLIMLALLSVQHTPWLGGTWLGLGILSKSWPILLLPVLLQQIRPWRSRIGLLLAALAVPLLGVGLYLLLIQSEFATVVGRALGYNRGIAVWGYTFFFRLAEVLNPQWQNVFMPLVVRFSRYLTLGLLAIIFVLRVRHEPIEQGSLTLLVAFMALTHAFAIQYLVWIVPLAILCRDHRWLSYYTLAAWVYMTLAYTTLILEYHITRIMPMPQADWFIIIPAGLPAWLVALLWLIKRLRIQTVATPALHAAII